MMLSLNFNNSKVQAPEVKVPVASGTRQPTIHVCRLTCFYCWLSDRTLPFQIRFFCFAGGPGGRALAADLQKCKSPFTFFVQFHQFSSDLWSRVSLHDLLHNWSLIFFFKTGILMIIWHNPLRASITMAVPGKVRKPLRDLGLSKLSSDLGW